MELSSPAPRRHLHTRSIHCEGFLREDALWDIEARIVDTKSYAYREPWRGRREPGSAVHDMHVRLTIDDAMTVHDIEVAMPATPYPTCAEVRARFRALIGLTIGPGWRAEINRRVGATFGCTHVRELLFPMATVAFQTVRGWPSEDEVPDAAAAGVLPSGFLDGCHAWAADGEVVATLYPMHAKPRATPADER
ncbi:MAG: DUF2889 domain-containing protein [Lautropia sp.]